jgi:hypothetical protein
MASRADLVLEEDTNYVGGAYESDWFDSGGIDYVRVASEGGNGTLLEESNNQTDILTSRSATDGVPLVLTARYFRATSTGGTTAAFSIAIRAIGF